MEHWYEFRAYNSQKLHGFGTKDEADQYADHLNRNRDINHYAAYHLSDDQASDMKLEDSGFSLSTALADIAEND